MNNTQDKWLEKLVENYQIPTKTGKTQKILTDEQINIINNEKK